MIVDYIHSIPGPYAPDDGTDKSSHPPSGGPTAQACALVFTFSAHLWVAMHLPLFRPFFPLSEWLRAPLPVWLLRFPLSEWLPSVRHFQSGARAWWFQDLRIETRHVASKSKNQKTSTGATSS